MNVENLNYHIDNRIFDYSGKTPLKVFARKIEGNDQTTYSIEPIRAKSKLFVWLQEHFYFFNKIITAILSRSLMKDPHCKIFDDLNVYPKSQNKDFVNALMTRIENEASDFFSDADLADHRYQIFQNVIANGALNTHDKIDLVSQSLKSAERLKDLFDGLDNDEDFKIHLIKKIVESQADFDEEILIELRNYFQVMLDNMSEFDEDLKFQIYYLIIESYYKHHAPLDESMVADVVKDLCDLIENNNNILIDNLPILGEIIDRYCTKDTFSAEVTNRIHSLINWDNTTFTSSYKSYDIKISFPHVRIFPEKVLESFYKLCFLQSRKCQELSIKALSKGQETLDATDAGGVRRQFIAELFEGLLRKVTLETSSVFATSEDSQEGWLPKLSKFDQAQQENLYIAIGKLMGMCLTSVGKLFHCNSNYETSYVIGKIFDPAVFDVIAAASPKVLHTGFSQLDDNTLLSLYSALEGKKGNKLLQFYNTPNLNACSEDALREMVTYAYIEDPDEMPGPLNGNPSKAIILQHQGAIRAKLKSQLVTYAKENDSLPLILKIAEGIAYHYYDRNTWQYQNWFDMSQLESQVQGNFDKQSIKDAINYSSSSSIISYLKQWIDESDDEMVIKFLKATTGSTALAAHKNIAINVYGDITRLPDYHTCSRSVDIPPYPDYETFKRKLEQSFACLEDDSFQLV